MIILNKCTFPHGPSSTALTNFIIAGPQDFDCFVKHQLPGAPASKITLFINVVTYYYKDNSNGKITLDDQALTMSNQFL